MTGAYQLCGLRVQSALPLPELLPWTGSASKTPDISIVEGTTPERLGETMIPGRYLMVGPDGSVLLHIVDLVRMLIREGNQITIEILRRDPTDGWRAILLGAALCYIFHQRGMYPLHAATVRVGGRVLAIAGHRGQGKSTLALALTNRGHGLLSDDLTVLRSAGDAVEVLPAYPRLKLWRNSLEAAGIGVTGLPRIREGMEKYDLRPQLGFSPEPAALGGILILGESDEGVELTPCSRLAAVPAIQAHIPRQRVAGLLGRRQDLFQQTARITGSVPVYRLNRPKRFEALEATAALIETLGGE